MTLGHRTTGVVGPISSGNSIVGLQNSTNLQGGFPETVIDNINNTYMGQFVGEDNGKVRVAPQQFAPLINQVTIEGGAEQRSIIRSITVDFDSNVTIDAGAFELKDADGTSATVIPTITTIDAKTRAVLTFSGPLVDSSGSLIDGDYTLNILDTHIRDQDGRALDGDDNGVAGGAGVEEFFRLFGDQNGDKTVNLFDFAGFRQAFGEAASTPEIAAFDENNNGIVDLFDFAAFRNQFGKSL